MKEWPQAPVVSVARQSFRVGWAGRVKVGHWLVSSLSSSGSAELRHRKELQNLLWPFRGEIIAFGYKE
jgi:hypothetical protein